MANDPQCYGSLDFCAIRAALLTAAGNVLPGANNGWRTDAGVKVDVNVDVAKGDDLELKNGCGVPAMTWQDCDRVKRGELTLDLSTFEVGLMGLMVNNSTFMQSGNVLGSQAPPADTCGNKVCLEGWTKAWNGANQAGPALLGGTGNPITKPNLAYFHWVFPAVTSRQDKWTLNHGFTTFPIIGKAEENLSMLAHGPFNDWPTGVIAAGGVIRWYGVYFDATLPVANCGFINVPGSAS